MVRRPRPAALVLAAAPLLAAALACGPSEETSRAAQTEVEELLAAYLPGLAEFYRTGDAATVEGLAAPRERERVESLIRERAHEGMLVDATLERFEVVRFDLYQHSNAVLTTREVWDLRVRAAGSDRVIQEELDKADRYRYQVKRGDDGGWMVLSREVVTPAGG